MLSSVARLTIPLLLALLACAPAWALDTRRLTELEALTRVRPAQALEGMHQLAQSTPTSDPQRWRLMWATGVAAARAGLPETMERQAAALAAREPASQGEPQAATLRLAPACLRGIYWMERGEPRQAAPQLEDIESQVDNVAAPVRLVCEEALSQLHAAQGDFEEALKHVQHQVALADQLGAPGERAMALVRLGYAVASTGDRQRALDYVAQALRIAQDNRLPVMTGHALNAQASIIEPTPQNLTLRRAAQELALAAWREADADRYLPIGLLNLADLRLNEHRYAEAMVLAQEAETQAQVLRLGWNVVLAARLNRALALISLRRKDEGLRLAREVIDATRAAGREYEAGQQAGDLGRYLEQAGYLREAYAAYDEYRDSSREQARDARRDQLAVLQTQFERQGREREAAALASEGALREAQLKEQTWRYRLWALGGVVSLVLLALALWQLWRQRQTEGAVRSAHDRAKVEAENDALTGLANRRGGEVGLARWPHAQGLLALVDVDHFKRVNDRYGHAVGDVVLVEVAQRIRACVRTSDLVARWGGEEFLILMPHAEAAQLQPLIERLLAHVAAQPVRVGDLDIWVTASIGCALLPLPPHALPLQWDVAVQLVDAALYLAKARGRHRAVSLGALHLPHAAAVLEAAGALADAAARGDAELAEWPGVSSVAAARGAKAGP